MWVYSAKFVCGIATPNDPLVPATYKTAINVHNPQGEIVAFTKKVVLAPSEDLAPIRPSEKKPFKLDADHAFEIDCKDIYRIGHIDPTTQPFAKDLL